MGYHTDFTGKFKFNRELTETEANYINLLSTTRRMKRDVSILMELYKGEHGNPFAESNTPEAIYGIDGEFFALDDNQNGQNRDASIIDYNTPPGELPYSSDVPFIERYAENERRIEAGECQPGLRCQWIVTDDRTELEWDENEKFYYYVEWLKYLKTNFFDKWGVELSGQVDWSGEVDDDMGKIIIENNTITVKRAKITYE